MTPDELIQIATRHQVFLERLKTQKATEFGNVSQELGTAIKDVVNALDVDSLDQLGKKKLGGLLRDLQDVQGEIIRKGEKKFFEGLREVAGYEAGFEAKSLKKGLADALGDLAVQTSGLAEAYKKAYDLPVQATGQLLEPFVKHWGQRHVEAVNNIIRNGWANGSTLGEMVKQIRGTKKNNWKDGLLNASRRNAEAMARTATQHVANSARMATWEKNKDLVVGYRFVATLDSRTSAQCRSLDGQTFELGKGPRPPIHVGCRSTTVADMDKEFDFLDEGATRSSKDGYVDAKESYYDWLKKQSPEFQDDVLGPARGKLFRDGGLSAKQFGDLQLDKNFQPLTLEEMKLREPLAFQKAGLAPEVPEVDLSWADGLADKDVEFKLGDYFADQYGAGVSMADIKAQQEALKAQGRAGKLAFMQQKGYDPKTGKFPKAEKLSAPKPTTTPTVAPVTPTPDAPKLTIVDPPKAVGGVQPLPTTDNFFKPDPLPLPDTKAVFSRDISEDAKKIFHSNIEQSRRAKAPTNLGTLAPDEKKAFYGGLGHSAETVDEINELLKHHTIGGNIQVTADAKLAQYAADLTSKQGKLLHDMAQYESTMVKEHFAYLGNRKYNAMRAFAEDWEYSSDKAYYANWIDGWNSLEEGIQWKQTPPTVYRGGTLDKPVLSWTQDRDGASVGSGIRIKVDHTATLDELADKGYQPVAGYAQMVGSPGEAEVLFIKFLKPKKKQ